MRDSIISNPRQSSFVIHAPLARRPEDTYEAAPVRVEVLETKVESSPQPALKHEGSPHYKFIRVKSDMECYKKTRRISCPLLVTDKSSDRYKIYDKDFNYKDLSPNNAKTAAGTPGAQGKKLSSA